MGKWSADSKTRVSHMTSGCFSRYNLVISLSGDFFSNEKSLTVGAETQVRIEHVNAEGRVTVLKDNFKVFDATFS